MSRSHATAPVVLACVVTLAACDRAHNAVRPAHIEAAFAISDGAHQGNVRFYFLPPLAPAFPFVGFFDPYVTPEVRICKLAGAVCPDPDIATFPFGAGGVSVDPAGESYGVNWKTKDYALNIGEQYRLNVYLNVVQLGYLDIQVIEKKGDAVSAGFTGIVIDKSANIKFRIEREPVPGLAFNSNRDLNPEIYWMDQRFPGDPNPRGSA
jgi:hypothetical protein